MADVVALLDRQTRAREAIRSRTESIVLRAWNGLGHWSSDEKVEEFLNLVVPVIEAAQVQTAQITEIYLVSLLQTMGLDLVPEGLALSNLRPVALGEVYRRPFVQTYAALGRGVAFDAAVAVGADRLARLVDDDISLAHRHASLSVISRDDNVTGFRRVVRPEFARGGSCGLCIAAAGQTYHRDKLLPIHTRCHCDVMPIITTASGSVKDPGRRVNDQDIDALYKSAAGAARSTDSKDLKRVRIAINEHGELGPVLTRSSDEFTSSSDIA